VGLYFYSPSTSSWRCAQLKEQRSNFTFTFSLPQNWEYWAADVTSHLYKAVIRSQQM